jgi:uncharacterized membrane protein
MPYEMVVLRLLHIVLGIFWAGTAFFVVSFLTPALRAEWPAAGQVMLRLDERRFYVAIAVAAWLTVLTGIRLYAIVSNGFSLDWIRSGTGICLTVGGIAGLTALIIGGSVIGPRARRLSVAMRATAAAPGGAEREEKLAEAKAAFAGVVIGLRWAARMLGVAVILMAIARYV